MKTILVAGGAGFIGSNLTKTLLDMGNKVICVDSFLTGSRLNVSEFLKNPNYNLIEHDIINPLNLSDIDEIYNLACPASPPQYQKDPVHTFKTSVIGNLNLLELTRKNNAKLLFSSTSEIYGNPLEHPQNEKYWGNVNTVGIRSCYDEGKRASETLLTDYHKQYGVNIAIVRIFNTYGPNMSVFDGRVVSNFIVQALKNKDITIYGDGSQTRSFCFVDDLIRGLILLMKSNYTHPVNLGNPEEYSVSQLANMIIKLTNSNSKIVYMPLPQDDPIKRKPDISLAFEKLNWKPKIPLSLGLDKTIEYFRNKTLECVK